MVTLTLDKVGVKMGGRRVVRDASARFEAGTLVGVIGPNGAGKSSLVRAILALVASSGHILLDRVPIERMDRTSLARAMAYPIIPCDLCGSQEGLQRVQVKKLLDEWESRSPGRRQIMFRALMNARPSHLLDPNLFNFAGLVADRSNAMQAADDSLCEH